MATAPPAVAAFCQAAAAIEGPSICALPKPYTPRTSGKAERFIQMLLREWAYVYAVVSKLSPTHRAGELAPWMLHHNIHRPHSALSTCLPLSG